MNSMFLTPENNVFAKSAKIDFNLCMIDMGLTRENVTQLGH